MIPTGALSVVTKHMVEARELENFLDALVDQKLYHTAITLKTQIEATKTLAGFEFLLWLLAVLNMPQEPKP
jgi:hypothetical protein